MAQTPQGMNERFIRETGPAAAVAELALPVLDELGFELVRVRITGHAGTTVQIMIDRTDGAVSVEDCALVSRRLSPLLDAFDPIAGGYHLEVSSPGMDRPLVRPRDFLTWAGYEAKVELKELVGGRRRFRGEIKGFEDGEVRLKVELDDYDGPQTVGLSADLIGEAKLTVKDADIKRTLKKKPEK